MPATYQFAPQFIGDFEHRQKVERAERQRMTATRKRLARNPFFTGQKEGGSNDDNCAQPMDVDAKIDVSMPMNKKNSSSL